MGQRPNLKQTSWGEEHRAQVLLLHHTEHMPTSEIARRVGLSERMVRNHIKNGRERARAVTAELANEMREVSVEKLNMAWSKVSQGLEVVDPRDANKVARLAEAAARIVEQECKIWGLYEPTKSLESRLQVNLTKVDGRVVVHFDRDQLKPRWPTPYGPREPICNGMRERIADVSTEGAGEEI